MPAQAAGELESPVTAVALVQHRSMVERSTMRLCNKQMERG